MKFKIWNFGLVFSLSVFLSALLSVFLQICMLLNVKILMGDPYSMNLFSLEIFSRSGWKEDLELVIPWTKRKCMFSCPRKIHLLCLPKVKFSSVWSSSSIWWNLQYNIYWGVFSYAFDLSKALALAFACLLNSSKQLIVPSL